MKTIDGLPLNLKDKQKYGQYFIVNENGHVGQIVGKEMSQYIVHASNNFIKAVNLLKEALADLNMVPNNRYCDNYQTCIKIDKFLKKLKDE